jgi:AcrR family transcriptional regulator
MSEDVEAHVRRLWRHHGTTLPTPRRGPRQQLDLDEILDAAIELADTDGLAAVSTRAVAARFGRTAMALYPYVGGKEQMLALMQDHASALPPPSSIRTVTDWALAFFDLHRAHPWLTERPWAQSSQGPNERDWLERLLRILDTRPEAKTPTVTILYATVRACAETANAYARMTRTGIAEWQAHQEAAARQIPDLATRYPATAALPPLTADWQDAPRAGLLAAIHLIAGAAT